MTTPTPDTLWTVPEIATRLRVSNMTIYRAVNAGQFPGTLRVGRAFRVPESGVQAYIEASRVTSEATP